MCCNDTSHFGYSLIAPVTIMFICSCNLNLDTLLRFELAGCFLNRKQCTFLQCLALQGYGNFGFSWMLGYSTDRYCACLWCYVVFKLLAEDDSTQ